MQSSSAILLPRTVTARTAGHLAASSESEFPQTEAKIAYHIEAKSTRNWSSVQNSFFHVLAKTEASQKCSFHVH